MHVYSYNKGDILIEELPACLFNDNRIAFTQHYKISDDSFALNNELCIEIIIKDKKISEEISK